MSLASYILVKKVLTNGLDFLLLGSSSLFIDSAFVITRFANRSYGVIFGEALLLLSEVECVDWPANQCRLQHIHPLVNVATIPPEATLIRTRFLLGRYRRLKSIGRLPNRRTNNYSYASQNTTRISTISSMKQICLTDTALLSFRTLSDLPKTCRNRKETMDVLVIRFYKNYKFQTCNERMNVGKIYIT